jgi:hypothetical protein
LEGAKREKPARRFEQKSFENLDRIIIRGSVAYALMSGRDLALARDVAVFFIARGRHPKIGIRSFENEKEAEKELPPEEYGVIEKFLAKHNVEGKPIQVVRTTERFLGEMQLFKGEPEVVLWDAGLEAQKQLVLRATMPFERFVPRGIQQDIEGVTQLSLYNEGKLFRGGIPPFLQPSDDRLATALRLVDLGMRFGVEADDSVLRIVNERIRDGQAIIVIPEARRATEGKEEALSYTKATERFRVGRSRRIDIAFYNVARKSGIKELVAKRYPFLGALVEKIEEVGGIREFVEKEYGAVYLSLKDKKYFSLSEPKFVHSEMPLEEQRKMLEAWYSAPWDLLHLFDDSFQNFIEVYSSISSHQSMRDVSLPDFYYSHVPQYFIEASRRLGSQKSRQKLYEAIAFSAKRHGRDAASSPEYQKIKEQLVKFFEEERSKPLRKILVKTLVEISELGNDLTIVKDFVDLVRKESGKVKREKEIEGKQILSEEGMTALRALFALRNEDAEKAVFELLINPRLDSRLKKACLRNLHQQRASRLLFFATDFVL